MSTKWAACAIYSILFERQKGDCGGDGDGQKSEKDGTQKGAKEG